MHGFAGRENRESRTGFGRLARSPADAFGWLVEGCSFEPGRGICSLLRGDSWVRGRGGLWRDRLRGDGLQRGPGGDGSGGSVGHLDETQGGHGHGEVEEIDVSMGSIFDRVEANLCRRIQRKRSAAEEEPPDSRRRRAGFFYETG